MTKRAFTLIEVLVVIAIIGILAGLLVPALARAQSRAQQSACLSNLHQIGIGTALYLGDAQDRMPFVTDDALALTPPVDAKGKRYASMGPFMPLFQPYLPAPRVWLSPPVPVAKTNQWESRFLSPWSENGIPQPTLGWANYISDKLAELDPAAARYTRGRTPESVTQLRQSSPAEEEWLMSPFFERAWWGAFREAWRVGESLPPEKGWSAHRGGRNELYFDAHAGWIRRDIAR